MESMSEDFMKLFEDEDMDVERSDDSSNLNLAGVLDDFESEEKKDDQSGAPTAVASASELVPAVTVPNQMVLDLGPVVELLKKWKEESKQAQEEQVRMVEKLESKIVQLEWKVFGEQEGQLELKVVGGQEGQSGGGKMASSKKIELARKGSRGPYERRQEGKRRVESPRGRRQSGAQEGSSSVGRGRHEGASGRDRSRSVAVAVQDRGRGWPKRQKLLPDGCMICKEKGHSGLYCQKYKTYEERVKQMHGACHLCARHGHEANVCYRYSPRTACKFCGGRHNAALCVGAKFEELNPAKEDDKKDKKEEKEDDKSMKKDGDKSKK